MREHEELIQVLRQQGLQGLEVVGSTSVPELVDEAGHGQDLRAAIPPDRSWRVAQRLAADEGPEFFHVLDRPGLRVRRALEEPGLLALLFDSTRPVPTLRDPVGRCAAVSGDERFVLLDQRLPGLPAWLEDPGGLVRVFWHDELVELRPSVAAGDAGPPATVFPDDPLAGWLSQTGDTWLQGLLQARGGLRTAWHQAADVGLFFRLRDTRLDAGMPRDAERLWARSWTAAQLAAVEAGCWPVLDLLGERLEELEDDLRPVYEDWQRRLIEVCHLRDDLEGVLLLRDEARHASTGVLPSAVEEEDPFGAALARLDEDAEDFVRALPGWDEAEQDEQLLRAAAVDPDAWWTFLAVSDEDDGSMGEG